MERLKQAGAEDDRWIDDFLDLAVQVYDLIDDDGNGSLEKAEVVRAVQEDEDVIEFLVKCPHAELQDLLIPAKLESSLDAMDTDDDESISKDEWTEAIGKARRLRGSFRRSPSAGPADHPPAAAAPRGARRPPPSAAASSASRSRRR